MLSELRLWISSGFVTQRPSRRNGRNRRTSALESDCRPWTLFMVVLFLCLIIGDRFELAQGISWLAVAQMSSVTNIERETCGSLRGLTKRQIKLCRRNVEHMDSVKFGAFIAINECQYQFRHRRWNCSIPQDSSMFGDILRLGTREAAFVHAISSAGVAHTVTRHCSSGRLETCGCDRSIGGSTESGFQWAGCSDNVHYGSAFSRQFVDAHEQKKKQSSARLLMNLHNNNAGRKLIENNMRVQCKCHGVSGSCELKTCWRAMYSFREIGNILKEKFDGATEVTLGVSGSRKVLKPTDSRFKHQTDEDLVYLDPSPDYCTFDNTTGSLGTRGRICNPTAPTTEGCDLLCCGRGYKTQQHHRIERCNCKFHWCCDVRCKECPRVDEVSTCN